MQKHILIVSQYFYPEQFRVNDLAAEWAKRGYKVSVVTGIPNYPQGKFYKGFGLFKKRHDDYCGADVYRIPIAPRGKSKVGLVLNYFSFVVSGFFWKSFTRIKADYTFIFEVSPMTQALVGVWYSKRRKIPCYIYVQDLWPENVEIAADISNKKILNLIGRMVDYIYKRCNTIFVTSQSFIRPITERGVKSDKVVFWPQYAEDYYRPVNEKSQLIPDDDKINIAFTGNIGTAQGLEIIPEAAKILKNRRIKVRFNIIGDGRNKENISNQIKALGVDKMFNIIEWQPAETIPSILAANDAAVLSFSDNKLFSMTIPAKLQSYMACGIPIIASVSGESKEIVENANCGLTCDIGSAESLADTIIGFLKLTENDKQQMRTNAVEYTEKYFNKSVLLNQIDEYFNR